MPPTSGMPIASSGTASRSRSCPNPRARDAVKFAVGYTSDVEEHWVGILFGVCSRLVNVSRAVVPRRAGVGQSSLEAACAPAGTGATTPTTITAATNVAALPLLLEHSSTSARAHGREEQVAELVTAANRSTGAIGAALHRAWRRDPPASDPALMWK
jgi:hypothetical protein